MKWIRQMNQTDEVDQTSPGEKLCQVHNLNVKLRTKLLFFSSFQSHTPTRVHFSCASFKAILLEWIVFTSSFQSHT